MAAAAAARVPILPRLRRRHSPHLLAQLSGRDGFGVGVAASVVHQQFALVGVGQGKFQGAFSEGPLALRGVPVFVGVDSCIRQSLLRP